MKVDDSNIQEYDVNVPKDETGFIVNQIGKPGFNNASLILTSIFDI